MTNATSFVTFDKNIYQALSRTNIDEIAEAERAAGIVATASPYVLAELVYRLARPSRGNTEPIIRSALRRLIAHCELENHVALSFDFFESVNFVAFKESNRYGESQQLAELARTCARADVDITDAKLRAQITAQADELERQENEFVARALTFVRGWRRHSPGIGDPSAKNFFLSMLAQAAVHNVAASLNRNLTQREKLEASLRVHLNLPLLLNFHYRLYRLMDAETLDLRAGKRINDMWDLHLISSVYEQTAMPFLLVTCDQPMLDLAFELNSTALLNFDTYVTRLGPLNLVGRIPKCRSKYSVADRG